MEETGFNGKETRAPTCHTHMFSIRRFVKKNVFGTQAG